MYFRLCYYVILYFKGPQYRKHLSTDPEYYIIIIIITIIIIIIITGGTQRDIARKIYSLRDLKSVKWRKVAYAPNCQVVRVY